MWGGKSHLGLDCSALVQLAIQSINKRFPRNTDEQFKSNILKNVSERELDKGTLIFWKGHVAIAINKTEIIHSNAFHMKVAIEKFCEAKNRIESSVSGSGRSIKEVNSAVKNNEELPSTELSDNSILKSGLFNSF